MMGNQPGKQITYREYDVSDVESDTESDVQIYDSVHDVEQGHDVQESNVEENVDIEETQEEQEVQEVQEAEPDVQHEEPKKRRRRGRRGKKAPSTQEAVETSPIVKEEDIVSVKSILDIVEPQPQPQPQLAPAPLEAKKPKKEKKKKVKEEPVVIIKVEKKQKPEQKPKSEPKPAQKPAPKQKKDTRPEHLVKTVPRNELTEEKKEELIKANGPTPVKANDRTCFACKKICISRHQLNHHYGMCQSFPRAYESLKPDDRTWYMMIQYVRNDMKKASCLCMGCGVVFKKRNLLLEHNVKCRKAMDLDMWDRLTCFGLLFGTPYDDFLKFLPKYKERKTVPEFVSRVHRFVEDVKAAVLKEKADEVIQESRMKIVEEKAVKSYVDAVLQKDTMGSTIGFGLGNVASVGNVASIGGSAAPSATLSQKSTHEDTADDTHIVQDCSCSRCKNAHIYPPVPHSDVWGAEKEGYFIIPMTLDGYTTVLNGRTIHIPTQNVMLRIHDVGPA